MNGPEPQTQTILLMPLCILSPTPQHVYCECSVGAGYGGLQPGSIVNASLNSTAELAHTAGIAMRMAQPHEAYMH